MYYTIDIIDWLLVYNIYDYTEHKPKNKKRGRPGNEATFLACLLLHALGVAGKSRRFKINLRSLIVSLRTQRRFEPSSQP